MTGPDGRRRILFVCTANICRSPTAELLARHRFGEDRVLFRSAGFLEPDRSCPIELVEVLRERGIDATGHRSYRLDADSVAAADLLLTMEGSHVQEATMLAPDAFAKIVPLREAASATRQLRQPSVTVEELLAEVNTDRDPRRYLGSSWDVDDPYGRRQRAYRRAVEEIDSLVDTVLGHLR